MEQTLAEVWESSRFNQYSWLLPTVLVVGCVVFVRLAWVKQALARRGLKLFLFCFFCCLAICASGNQIVEKWRIRHEWGRANEAWLTEEESLALISDGANLLMGPFIYGGGLSILFFGTSLAVSSVIVRVRLRGRAEKGETGEAAAEADCP